MPSFRPESVEAIEQRLESLDRLSVTYTEAIQVMSHGDVETASRMVESAGLILGELEGWDEEADSTRDQARQRLRTKARAVLGLHSRLLDTLHEERDQVARRQKGLSLGRRHLDSPQPESHAGSILDSEA